MSATTSIEWTDRTWNPVRGCSRVSAGCDHCYAEGVAARFSGPGLAYEGLAKRVHGKPHWTGKIALVEDALTEPLHWRKPCRVFVNSMSDLFHEGVPDSFIDRVFAVMALCPQHTFQILTKRPERMRAYVGSWATLAPMSEPMKDRWDAARRPLWEHFRARQDGRMEEQVGIRLASIRWPLPNVHLGVSVEDQAAADARIPLLLATPAAVRFISAEPLLGAVDLRKLHISDTCDNPPDCRCAGPVTFDALQALEHCGCCVECDEPAGNKLDWVIVGGESGAGARPMHPDWARSLRDQCVAADVPFFFKQHGEFEPVGPLYLDDDTEWHLAALDALSSTDKRIRLIGPSGYDWTDEYERVQPNENAWVMRRVGKKRAGRMLDGREWSQFPGDAQPGGARGAGGTP